MDNLLKLTGEEQKLSVQITPPYDVTVNYEDGSSEVFQVRETNGNVTVTPTE